METFRLVRVRDKRTGAESLTRESWIDPEVHERVEDSVDAPPAAPAEEPDGDSREGDTEEPVPMPGFSPSALARMSVARLKELPQWGLVPAAVKARCVTKGDIVSAIREV
jgi:hypothetical protein